MEASKQKIAHKKTHTQVFRFNFSRRAESLGWLETHGYFGSSHLAIEPLTSLGAVDLFYLQQLFPPSARRPQKLRKQRGLLWVHCSYYTCPQDPAPFGTPLAGWLPPCFDRQVLVTQHYACVISDRDQRSIASGETLERDRERKQDRQRKSSDRMPPKRYTSVRHKSRPVALMPFRDDTSLVAFRYDQAAQAEPPIPIPPAKSPLRYQRAAVAAARARAATAGATGTAIVKVDARPASCISAPAPATIATTDAISSSSPAPPAIPIPARTRQSSAPVVSVSGPTTAATPTTLSVITPFPVIVAPPHPPPSGPLPLLPGTGTEEHLHPALRSAPRSSDPDDLKNKRDSGHAPTTTSILTSTSSSSRARTFYDESSEGEVEEEEEGEDQEDEDPFPYEKIQSARRSKFVPALVVPPLRIRSSSPTSLYAQTHNILGRGDDLDLGGTNNNSVSSIPLHSPGLSEANTVSPTSPTTPPPNFPVVGKTSASSSIFSRRSFSFRTSGSSSMKSSKRLKKKKQQEKQQGKQQQQQQQQRPPLSESPAEARDEEPSTANPTLSLDGAKATTSSSTAPVTVVAPPRNGDEQSSRDHHQENYHHSSSTRLPNSPKLVTDASAHDGDDFADFVQQISFSKRGSIMLGGMRPSRHAANMSNDSGFAHHQHGAATATATATATAAAPMSPSSPDQRRPQRVFPLASPPRIKANKKNDAAHSSFDDGDHKAGAARRPLPPSGRMTPPPPLPPPTPPSAPYADAPTTPKSARRAPSIRLISVEVERESQKFKAKPKHQHKYKSGRSTWSPADSNWDPRVRGAFCVATR